MKKFGGEPPPHGRTVLPFNRAHGKLLPVLLVLLNDAGGLDHYPAVEDGGYLFTRLDRPEAPALLAGAALIVDLE